MIAKIGIAVSFLLISFWFFYISFGNKGRLTNSAFFLFVILFVMWIQALLNPALYSIEFSLLSWKAWVGITATVLYLIILPVIRNEFFIMGVFEEDFYYLLESFLKEMNIPYHTEDNSSIPIPNADSQVKWFFIYGTKTGFIRFKSRQLYKRCQDYIGTRMSLVKYCKVSYEKILFSIVGFVFLIYSLFFLFSI